MEACEGQVEELGRLSFRNQGRRVGEGSEKQIHVNVWQKPLQYCKVISLQLITHTHTHTHTHEYIYLEEESG